jgi:hypothetical protein
MKRSLFALALALASATAASAQPPIIPTPTPAPPAPEVRPPIPTARWMFAGPPGVFFYDSGDYLLGGAQGISRSTGAFTMSGGNGTAFGAAGYGAGGYGTAAPAGPYCAPRGRLFHK